MSGAGDRADDVHRDEPVREQQIVDPAAADGGATDGSAGAGMPSGDASQARDAELAGDDA